MEEENAELLTGRTVSQSPSYLVAEVGCLFLTVAFPDFRLKTVP